MVLTRRVTPTRVTVWPGGWRSVWLGTWLLGATVLIVGGSFIVGNSVVPAWAVAGVFFLGAGFVHIRDRQPGSGTASKGSDSPLRRSLRATLTVGAIVTTVVSAGFALISDRTVTILSPSGPGGCRLVAVEEFFLLDGRASLSAVGPWVGWVDNPPVGPTDYRPFTGGGDYTLSWQNGVYNLAVAGDPEALPTMGDVYAGC